MENIELQKYIGASIRELRKGKKMTQEQLGDCMGLKHNSISAIERGINSIDMVNLYSIMNIFDIQACDLLPSSELNKEQCNSRQSFIHLQKEQSLSDKDRLFFQELLTKINSLDVQGRKKLLEMMDYSLSYYEKINS